MDANVNRLNVVRLIENDAGNEYRSHLVDQLYEQFLHCSMVGDSGAAGWVAYLRSGATVEQLEAGIVGSAEYGQSRTDGTTSSWLDAFFADVYHRSVEDTARAYWSAFSAGKSIDHVALAMLSLEAASGQPGNEYGLALVDRFYHQYLDRSAIPDPVSLVWVKRLQKGLRYEEIAAEIICEPASNEFYNKTAP